MDIENTPEENCVALKLGRSRSPRSTSLRKLEQKLNSNPARQRGMRDRPVVAHAFVH
jgi:hypothetical protein